jgi:hypothetical protein
MRRTTVLAAALASVASLALTVPAADAVGAGRRLTGIASCDQGGHIRLTTTVNAAGTEHGKATVSGVRSKRWQGSLLLDPDALYEQMASDDEATSDAAFETLMNNTKRHVAKHGSFTVRAALPGARTLDATATFGTAGLDMCTVGLTVGDGTYAVSGNLFDGLTVRTGRKPALAALASGESHHRYRIAVTVRTKAGVRHVTTMRTAGALGFVKASVRGIKGLASFREASVTITDTSLRPASVETYTLIR